MVLSIIYLFCILKTQKAKASLGYTGTLKKKKKFIEQFSEQSLLITLLNVIIETFLQLLEYCNSGRCLSGFS